MKQNHNTVTVTCEKSKTVFITSLIMKNVAFHAGSKFPVKIVLLLDQHQVLAVQLNLSY